MLSEAAKKIEAFLFLADDAVSKQELMNMLGTSAGSIDTHIAELGEVLRDHGLTLIVTDQYVQLSTSPAVSQFLLQFLQEEEPELSKAAAETLALIAYRGPISRYDTDVLRGVDSRRMIRQLTNRGLVRKIYQKGRTPMYEITEEFLQYVGVSRRQDLPQFETLSNHEKIKQLITEEQR